MGYDLEERALSPINKISKLIVKGIVDNRRGRASAGPALEEALAYAEAGFEPAYIALVGLAQLEAAWLVGDAAGIRQEAKRVLATQDPLDPWYRGSFIAWLRRCGLHDLESELTKRDVAPPYEALLAGDHRAAAAQWRDLKVPHEEALALLDSGEAELMQQAIRILESLGATATVARAQALMRQHGHASIPRGARADTRANRFGLTRREQEVLALISQGLTNGDIAGRLFIAEKTVDNHVSNVLAKLNVGSRHDAAKVAAAI
jgi:DNA-binding CsgD family transcriptional regulator